MDEQNDTAIPVIGETPPVITTMVNMINYLNVCLYEGQFTHNHEQSRAELNNIFDIVSKNPTTSPPLILVQRFHNCVVSLRGVTYTDDPDYHDYNRQLRVYIAASAAIVVAATAAATTHAGTTGSLDDYDDDDDDDNPREDNTGDWEDLAQQELSDWTAKIRRSKRFE
jgi:hypothetical protein